jgi:8-oxo-dGTP diphosphatase
MIEGPIRFCPRCGTALGEQLHTGKLRPACPACGWIYFPDPKVAVAALIKKKDQVLLVRRRYDPQKGHWTMPSGFVDAGEDPVEAVKRECLEETGLTIEEVILLDVLYSQEYPHSASILIVYHANIHSGELKPADDVTQAGYFPINDLPPLAFLSTKKILEKYF